AGELGKREVYTFRDHDAARFDVLALRRAKRRISVANVVAVASVVEIVAHKLVCRPAGENSSEKMFESFNIDHEA
ncbi:jg27223, partial [Pararge aegeria aegeria]